MRHRANESGFALFETLVATAIAGVSLAVVLSVIGDAYKGLFASERKLQAIELARSSLALLTSSRDEQPGITWTDEATGLGVVISTESMDKTDGSVSDGQSLALVSYEVAIFDDSKRVFLISTFHVVRADTVGQ